MPHWKKMSKEHPVDRYRFWVQQTIHYRLTDQSVDPSVSIITKNCSGIWSKNEVLQIRKHYYAMLKEVDELVGQVVKAIPVRKRQEIKF